VTTVDYWPNYLKYKSDLSYKGQTLEGMKSFSDECLEMAREYDIIVCDFACSFKYLLSMGVNLAGDDNLYSDLVQLKNERKKIFAAIWGSDVRSQSQLHFHLLNHIGIDIPAPPIQTRKQYAMIKKLAQTADGFLAVRNFENAVPRMVPFWETPLELSKWPFSKKIPDRITKIMTSVTSKRKKNYGVIGAVLNEITNRHPHITHKLLEGIPHDRIKDFYLDSDLAVTNASNGFGLSGAELMALGIPVVAGQQKTVRHFHRDLAPVIDFDHIADLLDRIEEIISGDVDLKRIAEQGRTYVETYHDVNVIGGSLLNYFQQALEKDYVDEIFCTEFEKQSDVWFGDPETKLAFKYFDISVPLFCAMGLYEHALIDANESLINNYRPRKNEAWLIAISLLMKTNQKMTEGYLRNLSNTGNKKQLDRIQRCASMLGDTKLLIDEAALGQKEAANLMGNAA
jgi:hypothetical protein